MNLLRMSALMFVVLQTSCFNDLNDLSEPIDQTQNTPDLQSETLEPKASPQAQSAELETLPARSFHGDIRHYETDLAFSTTNPQALQRRQVVWLSLDGLTVREGSYSLTNAQDDVSPIPEIDLAVFPALHRASFASTAIPSSAVPGALADAVQSHFSAYDVDVVTARPQSGNYTSVVVGGSPASMGIDSPNLLGIAPYDQNNENANDVVFVFSQSLANSRYDLDALAVTIVHELAHSFGLDHVEGENNIMAESICHCAQEFGAGLIVGRSDGSIQDAHSLFSNVFPPRQTRPAISCDDQSLPSVASSGSVLNEESACVELSGQARYWRSVSDDNAMDSHYLWTGAIVRNSAVNAATFSMRFESTGTYDIDAYIPPDAAASEQALYIIEHLGGSDEVRVDQRNNTGFVSLGRFDFEAGHSYSLIIGDNTGEPSSASKRVLVDSIRLTPIEETPNEETPNEETPNEETPNEETPNEETPNEETPDEQTPNEETPPNTCDDPSTNHSFTNARDLGESEVAQRCSSLDDYYRFQGDVNCSYVLELEHHAERGNLDLALFDSEGESLASAQTNNSVERVVQGGVGPMFAVVSANNVAEASYTLTRREYCRVDASCPTDDVYEPNDNTTSATRLFNNDAAVGMACNNDDVFKIVTQGQCQNRVLVEFTHARGDLDIELRSANGEVLANGVSVSDNEEIRFSSDNVGELFLRVYGYNGAQADYRVQFTQTCE